MVKDVAFCRSCNGIHPVSALPHGAGVDPKVDPRNPPPGCWYRAQGNEIHIGGFHRSFGTALLFFAFTAFWNSIVSLFVVAAITSTLHHVGIQLPQFPVFHINTPKGISVGETVFLWLFLTPFIGIGIFLFSATVLCWFGRTEIRLQPSEATAFVGVGKIGYKKRFDPRTVRDVRVDYHRRQRGESAESQSLTIELEDFTLINVGSMLPSNLRSFVGSALSLALRL